MKASLTSQSSFLALLIAVLIFSTPFNTLAQQYPVEVQAKMAAERDAETDTDKRLWTCVGCAVTVSPIIGWGIGLGVGSLGSQSYSGSGIQIFSDEQACGMCIGLTVGTLAPLITALTVGSNYKLAPSPERLLGKSPEYVDFYTNAYKSKIKRLRRNWGLFGVLISSAALMFLGTFF